MSAKLYVGNISFKTQEADLETAFGEFGTVASVKIITDKETGRSRGFGFVEMGSEEEATKAIENLDGKDVGGRNLRVSVAQDKKPGERGGDRGERGGDRGPRKFNR